MDLFRLDKYDHAARRAAYRWIDDRTHELAPWLRLFPRVEVEHVRTSRAVELEQLSGERRLGVEPSVLLISQPQPRACVRPFD